MPDNTSTEQSTPTTKADDGAPQSEEEEGGVPQASPATPTERSTTNVEVPVSNKPTSEAVPNNDAQTATSVATTPVSGSSTTVNADQQTLSATPSNANKAHDRGVSTGALAGGIIGAALAAALITGLVTFWYMRKTSYRNSRTSRHNDRHRRLYKDDKHTGLGAGRARRIELTSDASVSRASWEQYLPQSLDDHTIQNSVKVLFDQIQLHVENFYFSPHDPIKLPPEEHERLSELQTPHLPGPLVDCMMSSRSVLPVIKHCLAYQVAQGMMAGPQPRLLPMGFTYVGGDRGLPDSTGRKAVAARQAFNMWRMLTAYFRQDARTQTESAALLARNIEMDVGTFTDAFAKWRNGSQDVAGAKSHLEGLLKNAASVSMTLFSQPSMYQFSWMHASQKHRSLVVVPTFSKVTEEQGRALEQPQELVILVSERI
ncbi:hypothetical protein KC343_g694 [Hortaea werneckii]|uniref:Uncharacterized protein n=1 Tax=Hortaea werneckii TaxID=91943 RepID=A0A3M7GEX5_HORWE|nr:hypothetical protein KC338_g5455 [Hortaea werneckii]KAI7193902.1 hypothetical protein KC352_g21137 [Hortaea werneckii]KAI7350131.1 hypothetical protein KC320_g5644 [Hortaea werneckii]KAI7572372.1 hypothetical protein KC317_g823 [Hortaea werneckii]KAI7626841.1 hypothetical protein KC346_g1047 [Hortaea werneckii]